MIGKALLFVVVLMSAALSACTELNSVPIASPILENASILADEVPLGIPVTPAIIVGVYQFRKGCRRC
jgi:hypothetical protein